jgi:hypothetical protein
MSIIIFMLPVKIYFHAFTVQTISQENIIRFIRWRLLIIA